MTLIDLIAIITKLSADETTGVQTIVWQDGGIRLTRLEKEIKITDSE